MQELLIIGNGITGITAARNIRKKSDMKITIISSESKYFFSRTALMYVYMGHMKFENIKPYEDWFWEKNKINLIHAYVNSIDTDSKILKLNNNSSLHYDKLILATGSKSNKFGWKGQDLSGVQGLYSKQDLELLKENTKSIRRSVIVGGGLIGIELAEMLHSRNIKVAFLVRENLYWDNILPPEEAAVISRHILEYGFDLKLGTQLREILPNKDGRVGSVITDKNEKIDCQFVGLTPGVHPNIELVKDTKFETGKGILVNEYLETNIPDVYAAGDCVEIKSNLPDEKNKIEQLWYTGKMQGEALAKTILGTRTKYNRGIIYNSAKFLDIEYQTYGFVSNIPRENERSFYWEHSGGRKCIKIVYSLKDETVLGVNLLGIRMRHEIWNLWIEQGKTIDYVLEHLEEANFDPEFYSKHEKEILEKYNIENPGKKLSLKKSKNFYKVFA